MQNDIATITAAWDAAARRDDARAAIHPLGGVSDEAYDASGAEQARMLCELIRLYSPQARRVVDFGCGDGRVAKHLVNGALEVFGADASPAMIERLETNAAGVAGVVSNGVDGKLAELEADVIFSMAVFIHHSVADGQRLVQALADAVVPGGLLLLQIPCYAAKRERRHWIDVTVWDAKTLRATAAACGLEVLELHSHSHRFAFTAIGDEHLLPQVFRKMS